MTTSDSATDKRKHIRKPIETDYRLYLNGQHYTGKTSNISADGAFLIVPSPGLPPSSVSEFGDLDILIEDTWSRFRCEIIYVGEESGHHDVTGAGILNIFAKRLD